MLSNSELENKLKELEEKNQLLLCENQQLKVERVVTVLQTKEILPPGYENSMKRLKFLEKENKRFRKVLEYGNVSSLKNLIAEYKAMSKIKLENIVQEYQFYYTNHEERLMIEDFIHDLQNVISELKKYLFMDENESGEAK